MYSNINSWYLDLANTKGKYYFNNFYSTKKTPWFYDTTANRKTVVILSRIRSGHTTLRKHLFKFRIVNDFLCECGQEDSIEHIFWNCRRFDKQRQEFIKTLKKLLCLGPYSVEEVMNTKNSSIFSALIKFIDSLNIKF